MGKAARKIEFSDRFVILLEMSLCDVTKSIYNVIWEVPDKLWAATTFEL
jgi:hypothetical protein